MRLVIEYLQNYDKSWGPLAYKHADDSGFDLRAAIAKAITLAPGEHTVIPNGFKMKIDATDNAFELQTRPRSGLAAKFGISVVNSPGTVDFGYRGEVMTILINLGKAPFVINPGDRIAQAIICPIVRPEIEEGIIDDTTTRSAGGFGSTGVK
ncbi:MAG: dUTP diphosphatase [Alphaproteobacteria bacterium]